jgi:methylenetetrahydrofolate dehydrogenase (NADP+)/methenyltetrahydrofolate cyclohydrolase
MAIILDGRKLSKKILKDLNKKVSRQKKKLRLAAVLVGQDPASLVFLKYKEKACREAGVGFKLYKFSANISQELLAQKVKAACADGQNSGVVIQLPLPRSLKAQEILNLVPIQKDVDKLSENNLNNKILSPVLQGIADFFKEYKIKIKGKNVVVLGKGKLVGKPAADWAQSQGAKVVSLDSATKDISKFTKKADILICGTGQPGLVKGEMVKRGVVVIDAGTAEQNKKLSGDIDFQSVAPKAGFITPVPGGVGPMTVVSVIKNLVNLNKK